MSEILNTGSTENSEPITFIGVNYRSLWSLGYAMSILGSLLYPHQESDALSREEARSMMKDHMLDSQGLYELTSLLVTAIDGMYFRDKNAENPS